MRLTRIAALAALSFFGLNYSWSHVALASLTGAMGHCPSSAIEEARTRVQAFVGTLSATPWIICQRRSALGLDISHGTTRFAPFLSPFVVVGPFGVNVDVIAHELMHAEIAARTSALLRTYRVPTWFDEGLAMQLDRRSDYDQHALKMYRQSGLLSTIHLDQLASPAEFFRTGDEGKAHYAFAKCVVGRWLAASGPSEPMKVLTEVSWFRTFPNQRFDGHEKACLERSAL